MGANRNRKYRTLGRFNTVSCLADLRIIRKRFCSLLGPIAEVTHVCRLCVKDKNDEMSQQHMKGKKKYNLNRIITENGYRTLIHWKCDICETAFRTFRQLKTHKVEFHTH